MTPYLVIIHDGSHFPGKHFREVRVLLSTLVKKITNSGDPGTQTPWVVSIPPNDSFRGIWRSGHFERPHGMVCHVNLNTQKVKVDGDRRSPLPSSLARACFRGAWISQD